MTRYICRFLACLVVSALAHFPVAAEAAKTRPNFLLIVADDLAFTDLGAFGGEIATPHLDALAAKGVKLTSFYTAPTCSPSRAMLLTGQDAHRVGLGTMAEALHEFPQLANEPGYEGFLDPQVPTIAGRLGAAGYRTLMTGKWHLGYMPRQSPKAFGFQKSFVLLQGGADHFGADQARPDRPARAAASYQEDGAPARYPVGTYSTDFYTTKMLEYLEREPGDQRPFFAYLAYTAPHWPIQAPDELIDSYKGRYDAGPRALQNNRWERLKQLRLLDDKFLATPPVSSTQWDTMSAQQRALSARTMEVYAAMVDSLDRNVGRVLAALEKSGELENTVVVFMSDNGAEGLGQNGLSRYLGPMGYTADRVAQMTVANTGLEHIGRPGSFVTYGPDWARASTGPFRLFKGTTNEGGIRAPAFVAGAGISGSRVFSEPVSVRDIFPTLLDLGGMRDTIVGGDHATAHPPLGHSWAAMLDDNPATQMTPHAALHWEFVFRRAIRQGNRKAVFSSENGVRTGPPDAGAEPPRWRLYDLNTDPGEEYDLAKKQPAVLEEMIADWNRYARANNVVVAPPTGE